MTAPSFLSDQRIQLLLFGGKGGVGKTTCAAATAVHFATAAPDRTFAVVSTDPAHSLMDSFAGSIAPPNLKIFELDAQESLRSFKTTHYHSFREIASRGTFLDEDDISKFLDLSLPGLDEVTALLEISSWVAKSEYDCIVVDTAPTGHTLRLLAMPELIQNWLRALDALLAKHRYMRMIFRGSYKPDELDQFLNGLSGTVTDMQALLQDPDRCRFIPVTLAENVVIHETVSLLKHLEASRIPVAEIVVNRWYGDSSCPVCAEGLARQTDELKRFLDAGPYSPKPLWTVPYYPDEVRGIKRLEAFWDGVMEFTDPTLPPLPEPARLLSRIEASSPFCLPETTLLLFSGKGGVGKSTLACATALRLARDLPQKEVLLFSSDPAHSLSDCLGIHVGPKPRRITSHLTALEIDAEAAFDHLKTEYQLELEEFLKCALPNLDLAFDQQVMERILDLSPPGLDEVMAMTTVVEFLMAGKYDVFVLDAAPTAHFIRLMELPDLVDQWLKVFFGLFLRYRVIFNLPRISQKLVLLSKQLKYLKGLLCDPVRSALHSVSIPTEMAFQETKDLMAACDGLKISVPVMFLNFITPPGGCPFCSALYQKERAVLAKYRAEFPQTVQALVYRQTPPYGLDALESLGELLYRSPTGPCAPYAGHTRTDGLARNLNDKE